MTLRVEARRARPPWIRPPPRTASTLDAFFLAGRAKVLPGPTVRLKARTRARIETPGASENVLGEAVPG